jgi:hypothetical protein
VKKLVITHGGAEVRDMTPEEIASTPQAPPPLMPTLTRRQLRLWLLAAGKEDADVRAAIATISDERARKAAVIEWEDSTVFLRVHPLIEPIATMLGLDTPDAIDAAWREASQI